MKFGKKKNCQYFCTGCHKSAVRGCKQIFREKKHFIGLSATKSWEKSGIFRYYGLPEDLLSKGQKTTGGGAYSPPPHGLQG